MTLNNSQAIQIVNLILDKRGGFTTQQLELSKRYKVHAMVKRSEGIAVTTSSGRKLFSKLPAYRKIQIAIAFANCKHTRHECGNTLHNIVYGKKPNRQPKELTVRVNNLMDLLQVDNQATKPRRLKNLCIAWLTGAVTKLHGGTQTVAHLKVNANGEIFVRQSTCRVHFHESEVRICKTLEWETIL